ncbi:MAG: ISAs1 family transposase [Leptolyngbya sp.]|nr:MAG: ISAs1 family transposase [Leptolyngbya sp.]
MLYTPKKTVSEIVSSGNHYCIGLKANQPKLLKQAQQCAQTQEPLSEYQALDPSHGRVVKRRVRVFAPPPELAQDWAGLAAFVAMERSGTRQGHPFQRQFWFIISQVIEAQPLATMIQAHRGTTENKLHWVKDGVQAEDASLIQSPSQPGLQTCALKLQGNPSSRSLSLKALRFQ